MGKNEHKPLPVTGFSAVQGHGDTRLSVQGADMNVGA